MVCLRAMLPICTVLLVLVIPHNVFASFQKTCSKDIIVPQERQDCGWPGITEEACVSAEHEQGLCCFDNSVNGVPWCFYGVKVDKTCSKDAITPEHRLDCGWAGITRDLCESLFFNKGRCCYDDSVSGVPWCFHGATDAKKNCSATKELEDRRDCGWGGISPEHCTLETFKFGLCCFDNSVPDIPWCFYGVKKALMCAKEIIRPQDRKDCGWAGISQEACEARYGGGRCCFDNSVKDVNWCFFGVPGAA